MQIHDTHYDTYIEYVKTTITFILRLRMTKYLIIKKNKIKNDKVILTNILIDRVLCCCIVVIIIVISLTNTGILQMRNREKLNDHGFRNISIFLILKGCWWLFLGWGCPLVYSWCNAVFYTVQQAVNINLIFYQHKHH